MSVCAVGVTRVDTSRHFFRSNATAMRPPLVRLSAAAAQPSEVLEADGPPSEPRGSAIVSTRPQPRSDLALSAHRCVPLAFRMPRLRCVQLVHACHGRPRSSARASVV